MNVITTGKVLADLTVLIDDVEALVKVTADQTGERVAALRERLQRKLDGGKLALAEYEKELRERGEQGKACAVNLLRQESWPRLVAAVTLGLFIGLALRRIH